MYGKIDQSIKEIIIGICKDKDWSPLAMKVMTNHIHFFMSAPPKWAPSIIIKNLKGIISRRIRQKYPILTKYRKDGIWADSYSVDTALKNKCLKRFKVTTNYAKGLCLTDYFVVVFCVSDCF